MNHSARGPRLHRLIGSVMSRRLEPVLLVVTAATLTGGGIAWQIERLARRVATHLELARTDGGPAPGQLDDLRSCRYGLNTVLRLHFTQEEENYFSLAP